MRFVTCSWTRVLAAFGVAALAASAWAQEYTVTTAGVAQYLETRPSGATQLNITTSSSGPGATVVTMLVRLATDAPREPASARVRMSPLVAV